MQQKIRCYTAAQLEQIAQQLLRRYAPLGLQQPGGLAVDAFAQNAAGAQIEESTLSNDGHLLGLTAFADSDCILVDPDAIARYAAQTDDGTLRVEQQAEFLRRWVIVHECAHRLLHGAWYRSAGQPACFDPNAASVERPTTIPQWMEWQAQTLTRALLLPNHLLAALDGASKKTLAWWFRVPTHCL